MQRGVCFDLLDDDYLLASWNGMVGRLPTHPHKRHLEHFLFFFFLENALTASSQHTKTPTHSKEKQKSGGCGRGPITRLKLATRANTPTAISWSGQAAALWKPAANQSSPSWAMSCSSSVGGARVPWNVLLLRSFQMFQVTKRIRESSDLASGAGTSERALNHHGLSSSSIMGASCWRPTCQRAPHQISRA